MFLRDLVLFDKGKKGNEEYGEAVQTNNESSPSAPAGENEASAGGGVASVTVTNSKKVYYSCHSATEARVHEVSTS